MTPADELPRYLRWLAEPSEAHGIHTREADGSWSHRSYREIRDAAHGLAASIAGPASCLAVLSERPAEVLTAAGAAWLLGAPVHVIPQPHTFPRRSAYEELVVRNLRLAACDHVLVGREDAETAQRLAAALEQPDGRAAALHDLSAAAAAPPATPLPVRPPAGAVVYQFTSGSTGPPKLIRVSGANLAANLDGQARWLEWVDGEDAWSSWLPLNHDMGLIGGLLVPMARQSDLWSTTPRQFLRDPWSWLEPLADGRATITAAPTFGYGYAVAKLAPGREEGADFSAWKVATIGAEPVLASVLAAFLARFGPHGLSPDTLCPAYGMAEATLAATCVSPGVPVRGAAVHDARWEIGEPAGLGPLEELDLHDAAAAARPLLISCGPPIEGFVVRVVDEDGDELPEGHFGEVALAGTSIAQLTDRPAPGSSPVVPAAVHLTGDAGILLDGELLVVGRLGDGLKVRGGFVDCEGLEQRLMAALGLRPGQAALALGHEVGTVRAVLMARGEPDEARRARAAAILHAAVGGDAELHLVPVPDTGIPRTSSGKPQRRRIWELFHASRPERREIAHPRGGTGVI